LADNVALPLRFGSALSPRDIDSRLRVIPAAVVLEHFSDQVSRRPLRRLTGVRPPADRAATPDSARGGS
jgi:hypothetical protein